jgi:hypothetical protein
LTPNAPTICAVFEPRHADNGRDVHRPERRSVVIADPLIRLHVIDNNGLAASESLAQRAPSQQFAGAFDERLDAAGVLAPNESSRPPSSA